MSWSGGRWDVTGDVSVDTSDFKKLCEKPFEHELVAIPEHVTFHEAVFICDYLSGKIYSVDHDLYDARLLYNKLKDELDLQVTKKSIHTLSFQILFLYYSPLVVSYRMEKSVSGLATNLSRTFGLTMSQGK